MRRGARLAVFATIGLGAITLAPVARGDEPGRPVSLVKMPYRGERNLADLSDSPDYLEKGGLQKLLQQQGWRLRSTSTVALTPEEQKAYGEWNRLGLANGHLARIVAAEVKEGGFPVGLLANCSALMGMLGGLQRSGPTPLPLRVGLVFIDAHGDFNTPETTLSGMLGGMPVAISAGLGLTRLRLKSGLDPALPEGHIVLAGVRDLDPLEKDLLDRSAVERLSVEDIKTRSAVVDGQMKRLSSLTDVIYVHVDMDVLDPPEVSGHPLTVPGGPTSRELAAALTEIFRHEKAAAFGVASTPSGDQDRDGRSRQAAYNLILGALKGVQQRGGAAEAAGARTVASRTTLDRIYTAAQAERGKKAYMRACAQCHALDVYGGNTMKTWEGGSLHDFYELIATTMPKGNPGSLKRREYADVVAYILSLNSMPVGDQELPSRAADLKAIRIKWRTKS